MFQSFDLDATDTHAQEDPEEGNQRGFFSAKLSS
jgi:hypothetical protein